MGSETRVGIRASIEGYAGAYHSHAPLAHLGWDDENFSPGDKKLADDTGEPTYVLTPSGSIRRYDADPERAGNGTETTIGRVESYGPD